MPDKILKVPKQLTREAKAIGVADAEARTVRMSISSDEPYKRYDWWDDEEYWEVLDHGPGGIDDERLKAGLPILFNHSRDKHLGRGLSYENDGHKCDVIAKFSESEFAEEKFRDVKAGILVDTSVGYELVGDGICIGAKDELPIYKFRFKVYEGSLVTIPADASVGVGRQRAEKPSDEPKEILIREQISFDNSAAKTKTNQSLTSLMPEQTAAPAEPVIQVDPAKERAEAIADFKKRCQKIREWCSALKNEKWREKAQIVANKHMEGEAIFDEFRAEALNFMTTEASIDTPDDSVSARGGNPTIPRGGTGIEVGGERPYVIEARTLGELFVKSKEFRARNSQNTCQLEINGLMNYRATFATSSVSGYSGIVQLPQIYDIGVQRPVVADLIAQGTTNLSAVPYMQETSITNAATTVAEAGAKPEATFALTQTSAPVKKIAVTIPVTDEAFEDVATLESYINARLSWMVETTEEAQIINGLGTGSEITGILQTSGIQTQAKGSDTAVDAIRKAKNLKVRALGFAEPTGIVIHPTDWDGLQGLKDANNQYYGGGPFTGSYGTQFQMVERIWGLPAVVTTGITAGTALIGAFRTDAMIFRKKGITIDSTNSNASEFINNIIRLRAEERLALAVFRPASFCKITGL